MSNTWTRSNKLEAYELIFKDFFGLEDDYPLYNVFHGPDRDIELIIQMSMEDMERLEYQDKDDNGNIVKYPLGIMWIRVLQRFKVWMIKLEHEGRHPEKDIAKWRALSSREYASFVRGPQCSSLMEDKSLFNSFASPTTVAATTKPTYTPADLFKKGIKREKASFPVLKRDSEWAEFKGAMITEANAQGVEDVFDTSTNPISNDAKALFEEKNKFVASVLQRSLQTQNGKSLVRKYRMDKFGAQTIWKEVCAVYEASVHASVEAADLLSYITTARLGDGKWKGGCEDFIIHWDKTCDDYDNLCEDGETLGKNQRKTLLQNAVHAIDDLRAVKTTQDQLKAGGTITSTGDPYDIYIALLKSAAIGYDKKHGKFAKAKTRQVYQAVLGSEGDVDEDDEFDDALEYDIDTSVTDLMRVNRTNIHTFLPRNIYEKLTAEDRSLWFQMSKDAREAIIASLPQRDGERNPDRDRDRNRKAFKRSNDRNNRSINLADLNAGDLLKIMTACQGAMSRTQEADDYVDDYHDKPDVVSDEEQADDEDISLDIVRDVALLKAFMSDSKIANAPAGHIAKVMSKKGSRPVERRTKANATIVYRVTNAVHSKVRAALIDRGANGCIIGNDMRVISFPIGLPKVSIRGVLNHEDNDIPIAHAGGVISTDMGPVIAIVHQAAYVGKGRSIFCVGQMENYGHSVYDKSKKVGGKQIIKVKDGYTVPIQFTDGLPYVKIRPYTDKEWDELPHVFLTDDQQWDPEVLDHKLEDEEWMDAVQEDTTDNKFDHVGDYILREADMAYMDPYTSVNRVEVVQCHEMRYLPGSDIRETIKAAEEIRKSLIPHEPDEKSKNEDDKRPGTEADGRKVKLEDIDVAKYKSRFLWQPERIIRKTFENTTQMARMPLSDRLRRAFKTPNPALNVWRRNEAVAVDQVFANVKDIEYGVTSAAQFTGVDSHVTDIYPLKTGKHFVNTLQDQIRERGAMNQLQSDRGLNLISERVHDFLRILYIKDWQSEPHKQHQNKSERRYQQVKDKTNVVMDRTGCPAFMWLLCMMYVCFVLNHSWNETIRNVPLQALTGQVKDISPILRFQFWEPVYYAVDDARFPSDSREKRGRWVGIAENIGHALTYKIFVEETKQVIPRSNVRSALNPGEKNLRLDPLDGETVREFVKSVVEERSSTAQVDTSEDQANDAETLPPVFQIDDLIGRTFLMDPTVEGEVQRAKIVELIDIHDGKIQKDPAHVRFKIQVQKQTDTGPDYDEIVTYNELLRYLEREKEQDTIWKFKRIVGHSGPLKRDDAKYKGSKWNVMMEWENGEITEEPLSIIGTDDPITCALYARENNLLQEEGWKRFRRYAKNEKKLTRLINQAKLRSYKEAKQYKYGVELPRDYEHAVKIDAINGNTLWQDAVKLELDQIHEYKVFDDRGDKRPGPDYKKIKVHLVYDCKHDGRRKARLVADGHLTVVPVESVYSGVVSMRGIRLITFLAELNGLKLYATDIGNAYLEAKTKEKLYIVAGPEFGDLQGHFLVIDRALYGLRTSGARWHERFAECLHAEGFVPCRAEPDIWLRERNGCYEYIGVYVDDLAMAMHDPEAFIQKLKDEYKFKFKGTGPISFHLGCDFLRDGDGTLRMEPQKYIERMIATYERHFGGKPKSKARSPLEQGDHPELDTSDYCNEDETKAYQSLIGSMQWLISMGRFDTATAVMSMSRFRALPRKGHLERVKRIVGYAVNMRNAAIRFRVNEPDYSDVPIPEYDWTYSVYGDVKEELPKDAPDPLGRYVTMTTYKDANLMHCLATGRSVTAILHLLNGTPVDWFTKLQSTVETATFGSEFVSGRTAVEQIMELRLTLRYLGVPLRERVWMFGDNKTVVDSATTPHGKLHKRHIMLSYHRVREAIASGMIVFTFLDGKLNPADILSKHWGYQSVWKMLKTLLFLEGDTEVIFDEEED